MEEMGERDVEALEAPAGGGADVAGSAQGGATARATIVASQGTLPGTARASLSRGEGLDLEAVAELEAAPGPATTADRRGISPATAQTQPSRLARKVAPNGGFAGVKTRSKGGRCMEGVCVKQGGPLVRSP